MKPYPILRQNSIKNSKNIVRKHLEDTLYHLGELSFEDIGFKKSLHKRHNFKKDKVPLPFQF